MKTKYVILLVVLVATFFSFDVNAQCAMCKASLESNEGEADVVAGVQKGIGYLMLFPYILMGSIAYLWYRNYKKTKSSYEID